MLHTIEVSKMYATKVCWNAYHLTNDPIAKLWELCEADQIAWCTPHRQGKQHTSRNFPMDYSQLQTMDEVPSSGAVMSEATRQQILEHRDNIFSNDVDKHHLSLRYFQQLLSSDDLLPFQEVIDAGIVPRFVHFLSVEDNQVCDCLRVMETFIVFIHSELVNSL